MDQNFERYEGIVVAINETIKLIKQIDETIAAPGGSPGAFKTY